MGQYWIPVNLDKREYINPHDLASGMKLWEQVANSPGVGAALIILTADMPEPRGGGDLSENPVIGSWAGDRIAIVGDYAEPRDIAGWDQSADCPVFHLCDEDAGAFRFTDVTAAVAAVIESALDGKFEGIGWKIWKGKWA